MGFLKHLILKVQSMSKPYCPRNDAVRAYPLFQVRNRINLTNHSY